LLVAGCIPTSEPELGVPYSTDPSSTLRAIDARGASAVVRELWANPQGWDRVIRAIAQGTPDGLAVALALRSGSDAGASEELTEAVTRALLTSPAAVLRTLIPPYRLDAVCSVPSDPPMTYEEAVAELDRLRASVASLRDSDLADRRAACLRSFDDGRAPLRHAYGLE
jgi:hypothetical protein